jgi:PAS domain S-box-containing protein
MLERAETLNTSADEMRRLLVDQLQDYAIVVTDTQGVIRSWSPSAQLLFGYCEADIIGQSAEVFYTSEDIQRQLMSQEMRIATERGHCQAARWQVQKDGGRFWDNGNITPLRADDGSITGFARIVRDCTSWKQAEDQAKDSLEYAQAIVETVREPLVILDGELRVRTANRAFYLTFKVCESDTQGKLLYELGNQQWDIPELRRLLEDILPRDAAFDDFEVTHHFPSIGPKVMLLNARRIFREDKQTRLVLLAMEDVTEQRRQENERRELETRFTSLVKNIRDHSIFTLNPQGHITSWNREAQRILGYSEAEAIGQHFSIIFTQEDRQAGIPETELTIAVEQGRAEDERWHLRKNGERFWALGIVSPSFDVMGTHTGFSKILRDMTERKLAEEALQAANRYKDEFLATLAHELRNPLAPLRNGLQLLRLTSEPATARETHAMMERQLSQMVRLVDDLMDVSRITRDKLTLRKTRVELSRIIQNAIETARPLIDAKGHQLVVTLPPQPVYIDGDLTRLSQIFCNLLNNSAKYTAPGGHITLTAITQDKEVMVTVRDNGIGIPPESLAGLFKMFSQVDRSLERAEGGLGIGLALVKGLTEAHGGNVEVESDGQGHGSSFTVRLPIVDVATAIDPPVASDPQHQQKQKVLVVDDNRDAAASLAILMKLMGNEVRTANDGLQAVAAAEEFQPDLIVLDIGLPKLNGYDVCRRIREKAWSKQTLIIAATGWGQDEDIRRAKEAGFDHHLVKPIDTAMLKHLMSQRP